MTAPKHDASCDEMYAVMGQAYGCTCIRKPAQPSAEPSYDYRLGQLCQALRVLPLDLAVLLSRAGLAIVPAPCATEELVEPTRTLADYDTLQGLSDAMLRHLAHHPYPALARWASHELVLRAPRGKGGQPI